MAYKIHYGHTGQGKTGRTFLLSLGFLALFLVLAHWLLPSQIAQLRGFLLGQANVEALLQDLRDGMQIGEAVAAFCQDVLGGQ